ncbi:MAG: FHA domain-containing protein [Defluviitaleaceae bacterium]|nr:FHA domain-containing protein [Defluviitaleaceae bacterium]
MTKKQTIAIVLDILIIVCTALCLFLLFRWLDQGAARRVWAVVIILPALALAAYEIVCWSKPAKILKKRDPLISTLVLLGEDDRPIRVWDLTGKVGLLIGKSSEDYQVDIDLSETDYHTYIDPEHALLNYQESGWWLQDTSSRNGVSIIRKGKELMPGRYAPAKLEPGDVICIAQYTRIAVN